VRRSVILFATSACRGQHRQLASRHAYDSPAYPQLAVDGAPLRCIPRQGAGVPADPLLAVLDLAQRQDDVVLLRQARALGLSDRRCRQLRQMNEDMVPLQGMLVVPPVRNPLRSAAHMALLSVPGSLICGPTAARLHGLQGLPWWTWQEGVHLQVGHLSRRAQRPGLHLHWSQLDSTDRCELAGLKVTSVERTLIDAALCCDRPTTVSLVDCALASSRLDPMRLPALQARLRTLPGGRARSGWLALTDGRAESPSESTARLLLMDAGIPPDELQYRVRDQGGREIARLDMAYRKRQRMRRPLGLEVDSAHHDQPTAVYRDRYRQNDLVAAGWDIVRITARDVVRRPSYVVRLVRGLLARGMAVDVCVHGFGVSWARSSTCAAPAAPLAVAATNALT